MNQILLRKRHNERGGAVFGFLAIALLAFMGLAVVAIDFGHLDRQTFGDRALEQEVLSLFIHQANSAAEQIGHADRKQRQRLAHTLKGAARGVGAFPIADCLVDLEQRPDDAAIVERLRGLIDEASEIIASISR